MNAALIADIRFENRDREGRLIEIMAFHSKRLFVLALSNLPDNRWESGSSDPESKRDSELVRSR
jgi:hypothetical protein